MKMITMLMVILGLLGCCTNIPKNNHNLQFENSKAVESIIAVKYINKNKGITKTFNVLKQEEMRKLINKLIANSEPLRIHLEENEIDNLFNENDYYEITFNKTNDLDLNPQAINRFFYFLSGKYENKPKSKITYFFIETNDGQYIQSPFVAECNIRSEIEKFLAE